MTNLSRFLFGVLGSLCAASLGLAQPYVDPGWDFSDPVNSAQTQQWCARMFAAQDAADPSLMDGFVFSNEPPTLRDVLLEPAIDLFRKIYAHRLAISIFDAENYDVLDLVRDDPIVRQNFREYVLTGVLTTDASIDAQAASNHAQALTEALGGNGNFELSGVVEVNGAELSSSGLAVVRQSSEEPPQTTPPDGPFKDFLKCLVNQSLLECMSDGGLYWPDSAHRPDYPTTRPDFDCDDFARAMLAWIRNRLRFDYQITHSYKYMGISWECLVDGKWVTHSHAVCLVLVGESPNQQVYVVDPQTGKVMGPYPEGTSDKDIIKKIMQALVDDYGICDNAIIDDPNLKSPNWDDDGTNGENPIWWHDRDLPDGDPRKDNPDTDMWKRFKDKLEACCAQHPPAPCGTGPGSSVSPCSNPDKYIWN